MEKRMRSGSCINLRTWIEQYMNTIPNIATNTRQRYRYTLLEFLAYLEKTLKKRESIPEAITQEKIAGWLKEMRAHCSLYTVLPRVGTANGFLSFLEKNGCLEENPLALLKKQYPRRGLKGIVLALVGSSPQKSLQALKAAPRFTSPLGPSMQKFIALGRSQGNIYHSEEQILCRLDRFLRSYSEPPSQLSDSILRQWLALFSRTQDEHRYKSFMVIRRFCLYLRRFDSEAYVPNPSLSPSPPSPFLPHIYSQAEIVAILKAVRQLKPSVYSPLRPQMFSLLILLLYTTGMRLGEALRLRLSDIDRKNQEVHIRETKFFKSRLLPLSSSMMRELEEYMYLRQRSGSPTNPEALLFQNFRHVEPYSRSAIEDPFRHILRQLDLKPSRGHKGPRIHDLRHSFAVHRLEEWYHQGEDVQSRLELLSTYLGHVGISSTQRYLTMTTELLQQASQRFHHYFFLNPF